MSQEFDVVRLVQSLKSHFKLMLVIIGSCVLVLLAVAYLFMPVKYKSYSVITIPSRYFQQPVVEDIIPSSGDANENRALREGLLKGALNREVMEGFRAKYNLFPAQEKNDKSEKEYEISMQKLQSRFDIVSMGATTFQVGYVGTTADQTFEIAKAAEQVVVDRLLAQRHQNLIDLRDNLIGRVDNLAFNVKGVADPISSSRPEVIQSELSQVQGILASLKSRFSEEHPMVKSYQQREKLLQQWLSHKKTTSPVAAKVGKEKVEGLSSANLADVERYSDLLKRLDRLNIVLEYETKNPDSLVDITTPAMRPLSPTSPNFGLMALWGLLAGMFLSMVYVSVKRVNERVVSPTAEWASVQKIEYLGKVPDLRSQMKRGALGTLNKDITIINK